MGKICFKCKIEKPFRQFVKNKANKDGLTSYCHECNREYQNQRRGSKERKKLINERKKYIKENLNNRDYLNSACEYLAGKLANLLYEKIRTQRNQKRISIDESE